MKRFENKKVIISGGNSGIGLETVKLLLEEGASVFVLDLANDINPDLKNNQKVHYQKCDISNHTEVKDAFKAAISTLGKLDIAVNNAGILGPRIRLEDYPDEDFDQVIKVNVNGVFYSMQAAITHFKEVGGGVIVNTASVAGKVGMARHIAYSASKHAVMGMTKSAAVEVAKYKIRVNAVCPGFTNTAMLESTDSEPEFKEMLRYATPMRRFGEPSEIANAILFLASSESSFMTGQGVVLDGGLSAQ
jgi:NAD(P)-dependent dehydrogenase (short-subunit alcohol dehydrogenase family)